MELREYLEAAGRSPFAEWLVGLDPQAKAKVAAHLVRIKSGNFSNVRGVQKGRVGEEDRWGPGYRVYFGRDGDELIILLGGGSKSSQDEDIQSAQARWADYKRRKKG